MILLADGGSTKVDWRLIENGSTIKKIVTKGANPFFRTTADISDEIRLALAPELKDYAIDAVHFYGAGCAFPEKNEIIRAAIAENIETDTVEVGSDLFGAAVGLCGDKAGIACILGTGSNSCFYDGEKIVENVSPLGFILGDEGSGAVLGRLFIGSCLKNQLTKGLKEKFYDFIQLDNAQILDRVYKQPMPNRFLASICPFIKENLSDPSVRSLAYNAFTDFFRKNVMQYDYRNHKVSFVGSVAFHFKEALYESAAGLKIEIGAIEQSPMNGLIRYYSQLK
ncbi:MAG: ATPase [Prevotella sp.]|jgi:N-acetylglucosamine kinase-like BadF-type ATPase|nr:ATPase [Prevotella sp.]